MPQITETLHDDQISHWHTTIQTTFRRHCRAEADARFDLSRIAYLTSESRKQLRRLGIKTHRELARWSDPLLLHQARTACYDL